MIFFLDNYAYGDARLHKIEKAMGTNKERRLKIVIKRIHKRKT